MSPVGPSRSQTWPTSARTLLKLIGTSPGISKLIARLAAEGHSVRDAESWPSPAN
jgi:hypothetical protein